MQRAQPLLGTLTQICAVAPLRPEALHAAVSAAFARIAQVHDLMSWHEPASELSRINRTAAAQVQPLHTHTRAVLEAALAIAEASNGAFDPCVAGRLVGFGLLPPPAGAPAPDPAASWRDIELSAAGVRFHRPLWIDLGGIAKGYAVDLAVECLQAHGVADILVNAGGDLRVAGPRDHLIAIRHPLQAHAVAHEVRLRDAALATSSVFESRRGTGSGSVSALVDPAGAPYAGEDSISVRAPRCMTADALTKVALFAPRVIADTVFQDFAADCLRLSGKAAA